MQKGRHWILVVSFVHTIWYNNIHNAHCGIGSPSLQRRHQRVPAHLPRFSRVSFSIS